MEYRIEKDYLGEVKIPTARYWGINTQRAFGNFQISDFKVPFKLIYALADVKKACALTNSELGFISDELSKAICTACDEIIEGKFDDNFILDALQGGAGTSLNMNINEVIANRALEITGHKKGEYDIIHPLETINLHQSTNDVYPTALKIAAINDFRELSTAVSELQGKLQEKEKEFSDIVMLGRTEMQDAVPMTLGAQFSSFAEAFARDRWRTFKCEERLRLVNIGGTAIGTGLTAPKNYIFLVIEKLRQITGLGISRAEQVLDNTANNDVYSEVYGMLNANAANIIKMSNDLRFLHYNEEIRLPAVQTGSSIMPGKINPVILESAISSAMKVLSDGNLVNDCVSGGSNQINEFLPLLAFTLLNSLSILVNTNKMLALHIDGIKAIPEKSKKRFESSEIIITAFLPHIGYEKAEEILFLYRKSGQTNFREFLVSELGREMVENVLSPANLMSLGYRK